MIKFLSLFLIMIFTFYSGYPVANAFAPNRDRIFDRFMNAVNKEDTPLQHPAVERAFRYLIIDQNPRMAKKLLAEAGWFSGFSLDLSVAKYYGDKIEIEWLITEFEKIGVYLKITDY